MSGVGNFTSTSASASSNRKHTNSMLNSILYSNEQEKSAASPAVDPETASVASYSSTTALLKRKFKKQSKADPKEPSVDAKKLQEQALKSQVTETPRAVRAPILFGMGRM